MKKFQNFTIKDYLAALSEKEPIPGGGSASAITAALGAALLAMAANYSIDKAESRAVKKRIKEVLKLSKQLRDRFLVLSDLDAKAYLRVVKARKGTQRQKSEAFKSTKNVSREICRLCYKALGLATYLASKGNRNLIGDVEAAVEMFQAAFNSSFNFMK